MTTEIELKYLLSATVDAEQITDIFKQQNIEFTYQERQLENSYFDTPDLNFRQYDMGLRVRRSNEHCEQTIKTAGQVVGGLHSRPEYNVNINSTTPDLLLFPDNIWHEEQSVSAIQQQLVILFTTHFTRHTWLVIDENDNTIEIAFDQGTVTSGDLSEAIYELELELCEGNPDALFTLAQVLFDQLPMRPGIKSKAARGYALWNTQQNKLETTRKPNETKQVKTSEFFICDKNTQSISDAFTLGLNLGLTHLQNNIAGYIGSQALIDLVKIKDSLAILRHGFWLFESYLTADELTLRAEISHFVNLLAWVDNAVHLQELTNKTGNYRKKIAYSTQVIEQLNIEKRRFPNADNMTELLHCSRFNKLQLLVLKMYLSRTQLAEQSNHRASTELIKFAQNKIQFSLSEVSDEMKSLISFNSEQYIGQSKLLYRSLLTGTWLSGLFDHELRDNFRRPWLDLQQGISELQSLWIIQQQLQKLDAAPEKLVKWQHSKVDGLLTALDNTKAIAITMPPYWLDAP